MDKPIGELALRANGRARLRQKETEKRLSTTVTQLIAEYEDELAVGYLPNARAESLEAKIGTLSHILAFLPD